jgi:nucleoside-diphosphate-sugar epimerase
MRVFVAGATGVIGRSLVPLLVQDGHEVTGLTHKPEHADLIRGLGAHPAIADALDPDGLHEAVVAARPEVVVHELTHIPRSIDPKKFAEQFERNNRLRREGTRNLVDAARAAGARRVVAQSVAFMYARGDGGLHAETDPLAVDMPEPAGETVRALADLEQAVTGADGMEGLVLRYGYFYGSGTSYASDGAQAKMVMARRFPVVGDGGGVFSFIHVDDAAAATVRALDRGNSGIYNVVDDDPAPVRDWLPVFADALEAPKPRRVPALVARVAAGKYAVQMMTRSEGGSNEKARRELGLELRYASWRRGFAEALG